MLKYLRGFARVRISGASPEDCLNRMTRADLPFWDLRKETEMVVSCCVYLSQLPMVEEAARRAQCSLEVKDRRGLPVWAAGLRMTLVFGVGLAVCAALYLQNYVWFVRVDGPLCIGRTRIVEALKDEGVAFGAWGPGIISQSVKHRLLKRIPELSWLAVNRSGGVVTVLYSCRDPQPPEPYPFEVSNIVAERAGIITKIEVLHGFPAVEEGDAVTEGQLLISGLAEWPVHTQATRSVAEVYAKTLRQTRVQTPSTYLKKVYTGRIETCKYLICQNKRRKISGNSSIFGTFCDKMRNRDTIALPGEYALPIEIETLTLREYRLEEVSLTDLEAEELLSSAADRSVGQNIIGRIISGSGNLQKNNGSYTLDAERYCDELISVTVPVRLLGEDGYSGESNQCREN